MGCVSTGTSSYCKIFSASFLNTFLGVFAKFRKATISVVQFLCPSSVRTEQLDGFSWNLILEYFSKICRESLMFV
jgi:hypothetical protein